MMTVPVRHQRAVVSIAGLQPNQGAMGRFFLEELAGIEEDARAWRKYILARAYWWPWSEEWPVV